jgi:hypothetical protein
MFGGFFKKEKKAQQTARPVPAAQSQGQVWQAPYGNWNDLVKPMPRSAQKISLSMEIDPVLLVKKSDRRFKKLSTSQQWKSRTAERELRRS